MDYNAHLEGMSLQDVFQILSVGKMSGIATVIHDGHSGKIVFRRGQVVYASSDTKDRLGYTLVDKEGYEPTFPFGHGLSYTTWGYDRLTVLTPRVPPDGRLEVTIEAGADEYDTKPVDFKRLLGKINDLLDT